VVFVDHAAEHLAALHPAPERHDDRPVMVGWPLVQSVQHEHPGRVPACTHGPVRVHRYLRRRVIILATGWTLADAIASLIVVALMLKAAWELLRDSGWILLEAAPKAMDLEDMRAHLLATEHVRSLHDLHAWTVTSSLPALSRIS